MKLKNGDKLRNMLNKDAFKTRRFWIWSVCLLIVVLSASMLFVHLERQPSKPFISLSLGRTNLFGTSMQGVGIEVSNRMSFNVNYWIEAELAEVLPSRGWSTGTGSVSGSYRANISSSYSIEAHSQKREIFIGMPEGTKYYVSLPERTKYYIWYERKLKPIEKSVLNKFPWLKQHYPFNRRRSFTVYESVASSVFMNVTPNSGSIKLPQNP